MLGTAFILWNVAGSICSGIALAGLKIHEYKNSDEVVMKKWFEANSHCFYFEAITREVKIISKRKTAKCRNEHREQAVKYLNRLDAPYCVKSYIASMMIGNKE